MVGLAEQQDRNGAAGRPRVRRVFSHPVILILCQASAVLAIYLMDAFLPDGAAAILIDRERSTFPATVQNLMWLVFALGVGELIVRLRDARAERGQLRIGYLPEDETTILQAHLHFSREGTNGAIVAFLCATEDVPAPIPPGTPRCPDGAGGIVTGTIEPDDVGNAGSAAQGIEPGEFDEFVKALRADAIYVNVHSRQFVPGEIRGQVR